MRCRQQQDDRHDFDSPRQRFAVWRSSRFPGVMAGLAAMLAVMATADATSSGTLPFRLATRTGSRQQHSHSSPSHVHEPAHRSCGHVAPSHLQRAEMKANVAAFYAAHQSRVALMARASSAAPAPADNSTLPMVSLAAVGTSSGGLVPSTITIKTYFHIANLQSGSVDAGDVPLSSIQTQIRVLNSAFAGSPFTFVLSGVDRHTNASWWNAVQGSQELLEFQEATYSGSYADYNVWVTLIQGDVLGFTSLPNSNAGYQPYDGSVINCYSMPGGAYLSYNLGASVIHESGHWLGLLHPFQDGCSEPNDGIDDTPEQAEPDYTCQPTNSCPNRPAGQGNTDPISNYMGYAADACMTTFTPDQTAHMIAAFQTYRASSQRPLVGATSASAPSPSLSTSPSPSPSPTPTLLPSPTAALEPSPAPQPDPPLNPTPGAITPAVPLVSIPPAPAPSPLPSPTPAPSPSPAPAATPQPVPTASQSGPSPSPAATTATPAPTHSSGAAAQSDEVPVSSAAPAPAPVAVAGTTQPPLPPSPPPPRAVMPSPSPNTAGAAAKAPTPTPGAGNRATPGSSAIKPHTSKQAAKKPTKPHAARPPPRHLSKAAQAAAVRKKKAQAAARARSAARARAAKARAAAQAKAAAAARAKARTTSSAKAAAEANAAAAKSPSPRPTQKPHANMGVKVKGRRKYRWGHDPASKLQRRRAPQQ